jgi:excisionase family DNA binding protein
MTKQTPKDSQRDEASSSLHSTAPSDEVVSTAEAAAILFVSRQHVVKLIDEGVLPLHHRVGKVRFIRTTDVLAYKEKKLGEAKLWLASQTEDKRPTDK